MADELDLKSLRTRLQEGPVGHTIEYHRITGSTMARAHQLAQDPDVRSGHVVITEQQTTGRGRRGRAWVAPYARALLLSVVLKPPLMPDDPAQIPMAAGIAVADALLEAVPELGGSVSLKWPNDVLIAAAEKSAEARKVAGILSEGALDAGGPLYAVLGIGVNVNQTEGELPAVDSRMTAPASLRTALGHPVDRSELLAILCWHLATQMVHRSAPDALLDEWRSRLSTLGRRVSVYLLPESTTAELAGVAVDVSPSGELVVRDDAGRLHSFAAADVSIHRPT